MLLRGTSSQPTITQHNHCAHIRATCLLKVNICRFRNTRTSAFTGCSALALRVHSHHAARRQAFGAETDSAANQFGAPESVNQRGTYPFLVADVLPLAHLLDL